MGLVRMVESLGTVTRNIGAATTEHADLSTG